MNPGVEDSDLPSPYDGKTQRGSPLFQSILSATFRANPLYELVEFGRLPEEQRKVLHSLTRDPDFFGVLRPRQGCNLPVKSVCRNTALLYLTLTEPGPAPIYFRQHMSGINETLAELVFDAVLEIEVGNTFVSGPRALNAVSPAEIRLSAGRLADLSVAALRYGEALGINDTSRLTMRLYCYNRLPISARWKSQFPSEEQTMRYLGILTPSHLTQQLNRYWIFDQTNDGWWTWRRANQQQDTIISAVYKLYLSPHPSVMNTAFAEFVATLTGTKCLCFKVGRGLAGMLRPDKMVCYFQTYEDLVKAAGYLLKRISNFPVQGVPFTANVGSNGLLSWAIDPPASDSMLPWERSESWRVWVTKILAQALAQSLSSPPPRTEPWQYALQRIRLAGVDVATWAPVAGIWNH